MRPGRRLFLSLARKEATGEKIFRRHVQSACSSRSSSSARASFCSLVRRIIKERRTTDVPEAIAVVVGALPGRLRRPKSNRPGSFSGGSESILPRFSPPVSPVQFSRADSQGFSRFAHSWLLLQGKDGSNENGTSRDIPMAISEGSAGLYRD